MKTGLLSGHAHPIDALLMARRDDVLHPRDRSVPHAEKTEVRSAREGFLFGFDPETLVELLQAAGLLLLEDSNVFKQSLDMTRAV